MTLYVLGRKAMLLMNNVKEKTLKMIENSLSDVTWDNLMYSIYDRQAIEADLRDSGAGRTLEVKELRARFGLSQ